MHKSSPLIEESQNTRAIRSSKRSSTQRNSNDYQHHPIPNPFLGRPDFLPTALIQQLSQLDYITPGQLQSLAFGQAASASHRQSYFSRQIQAMQRAARDQEQKMGSPKEKKVCFQEPMQEQEWCGVSLDEECHQDIISRGERERWALSPLEGEEQESLGLGEWGERPLQYFSMTDLGAPESTWDEYFDV